MNGTGGGIEADRARETPKLIVRMLCEADRLLAENFLFVEMMRHLEI